MSTELTFWIAGNSSRQVKHALSSEIHSPDLMLVPGAVLTAGDADDEDREYVRGAYALSPQAWVSFVWRKTDAIDPVFDSISRIVGELLQKLSGDGVLVLNDAYVLLRKKESTILLDSKDDFWLDHRHRALGAAYQLLPLNEGSMPSATGA
jgi:hypothetical protein